MKAPQWGWWWLTGSQTPELKYFLLKATNPLSVPELREEVWLCGVQGQVGVVVRLQLSAQELFNISLFWEDKKNAISFQWRRLTSSLYSWIENPFVKLELNVVLGIHHKWKKGIVMFGPHFLLFIFLKPSLTSQLTSIPLVDPMGYI